jgi:hypothetical protein
MDRGGVLDLLAATPTPAALRELGEQGIAAVMRPRSPRLAKTLPAQILAALDTQTVVVPGTVAFGRVIVGVATLLREVRVERDTLAAGLEARLEAHPLAEVLTSMPGLSCEVGTTSTDLSHHQPQPNPRSCRTAIRSGRPVTCSGQRHCSGLQRCPSHE